MQTKQKRLNEIATQITNCIECKIDKIGVAVAGEGNPDADVVFIGEAPGKQESVSGRPFIGRSGQLLRGLIRESGFIEADVFITSPVKYLPKRGTPTQKEIDHGRLHLMAQFEVIQPKIVILLGSTACKAVLGEAKKVLKEHGTMFEKDGVRYLITIHPAAVLRFPKYKPLMVGDFKKIRSL
ncbi:uracil-DNA glycosylase [Candidatus Woesebacteria bacterium]|nr:uracil-DNA glycosylase [Candidatus Woesebacteria bacterium]